MLAFMILFFPAAIMAAWRRRLFKEKCDWKAVLVEYIVDVVLINFLVIAIAYVFFNSQGSVVRNLNTYYDYALEYTLLAMVLAVGIPIAAKWLKAWHVQRIKEKEESRENTVNEANEKAEKNVKRGSRGICGRDRLAAGFSSIRRRRIWGGMPVFDLCCVILLTLVLSTAIYFSIPFFLAHTNMFNQEQSLDLGLGEGETITAATYTEQLPYAYENVKGVVITCSSYGLDTNTKSENTITISIWDEDTGEIVASAEKLALYTIDGSAAEFYFDSALLMDENDDYTLEISSGEELQLSAVSVVGYNNGASQKYIFYIILLILIGAMILMAYEAFVNREFGNITMLDIGFVVLILASCCLIYSQGADMEVTILHGKELLHLIKTGNVGELYLQGYLATGTALMYNFFLYLFVGIAIIPYWLFGKSTGIAWNNSVSVIYFCFILAALVLVSAYLVFSIARDIGLQEKEAKITAFLYLTSIIFLFGTLGFAQLDILYIDLLLLSLRFYIRKRYICFSLIMSVGIMLKLFPILIFVPLVLLAEKRVLHILKLLLLGLSCKIACVLTFENSVAYHYFQESLNVSYDFSGRIFYGNITGGQGSIALFLAIFLLICLWSYETKAETSMMWKYVILVPLITYSAFLLFVFWHPQWVPTITPFMALALGCGRKRQSLLYCEFGMGIFYWLFTVYRWGGVSASMLNYGILPFITGHTYSGIVLKSVCVNLTDYAGVTFFSLFAAATVYFVFMMTRDILKMENAAQYQDKLMNRGTVLARCAFMCGICLVYVFMYFYVG